MTIEQRLLEFKKEVQSQIDELDNRYDARDRERDEERREMREDYKKILSNQDKMVDILDDLRALSEKNSEGLVWIVENLKVVGKGAEKDLSIAEYERRNGRTIPWLDSLQTT